MTLKSDMLRAFDAEDSPIKDVTLVSGTDGGRISATKAVLAIRSRVFERMFFGNFQESQSSDNSNNNEVNLDYSTVVLRLVVGYCYMDKLDGKLIFDGEDLRYLRDIEAVTLVHVRDAANYLELADLHRTVSNELGECILPKELQSPNYQGEAVDDLGCVCAILQELTARGGSNGPFWTTCMHLVQIDPEACLLPYHTAHNQGILACSLGLFASICESIELDAIVAVKCIKKWNEAKEQNEEERAQLKKIADKIELKSISAADLAELEPCSLFPMEHLYKALVYQVRSIDKTSPLTHPNVLEATVRGAGVDCANGAYTYSNHYKYFLRVGKYGDHQDSLFRIVRREGETKWKIEVVPGSNQTDKFELHSNQTDSLVLYEATIDSPTENTRQPPFALWKCVVDGGDNRDPGTTPYVMVLKVKPFRRAGYSY